MHPTKTAAAKVLRASFAFGRIDEKA